MIRLLDSLAFKVAMLVFCVGLALYDLKYGNWWLLATDVVLALVWIRLFVDIPGE